MAEILKKITACNIRNYSIFHKDGLLFAYMEYIGDDFEADMAKMAADPKTQEWWAIMEPMQQPLETQRQRGSGGPTWKRFFIWINCALLSIKKIQLFF